MVFFLYPGRKNGFTQKESVKNTNSYSEIYDTMKQAKCRNTNEIIFEPKYYDELVSHKAKIKLAASNAVISAYSEYMRFVFGVACPAWKWISENHPESCKDNFEYVYDEDGNEHEIAHITEDMLKSFDAEYEKYKKEHVPKAKEITSKVDSLLNAMRADLGNEAYIRK